MKIIHLDAVDSTNDELKRRLASDDPPEDRTVINAEHQSAGRGRSGHEWISAYGSALTGSMIIYTGDMPPDVVPMLTILSAVAVTDAVEEMFPLSVSIKWPNDLLLSEKKFCGILCERIDKTVIIGIGVNLFEGSYPDELSGHATCISGELAGAQAIDRLRLCELIWSRIDEYYERFALIRTLSFLMDRYNSKLINAGRRVRIMEAKSSFEAEASGIDETGRLIVKDDNGRLLFINSGEVSVRGIDGYV